MNRCRYIINWSPFIELPLLLPNVLFLFRNPIQDTALRLVVTSPWACGRGSFSGVPCFWSSSPFGGVSVRCLGGCPSIGICLMFFSWTDCGLGIWEEDQRGTEGAVLVTLYQRWKLSTWVVPDDIDLEPLAEECLSSFSIAKLPFSPFLCCILWEEVILCSLH